MDRAMYGTVFWISALEKLVTLHKIIRVERVVDTFQLVHKIIIGFVNLCLQISPRSHARNGTVFRVSC